MRRLILVLTVVVFAGALPMTVAAQTPAPPAQTPAPAASGQGQAPAAPQAPPRAPSLTGPALSGVNVRLDITITDTFGNTPATKTASMTVMSGQSGMIRTDNIVYQGAARVRLNVDAMVTAYQSGQISTRLTVNYLPPPRVSPRSEQAAASNDTVPGSLEESLTVILADGKPLVVSESADPGTDRKVTLEVKATILK